MGKISDKTRKMLWGRAGARCAFCQRPLVHEKSEHDDESIVGDEAHIVSKKLNGPRGNVELKCDHDDYANLILLCKVHHKLVDDQPETYTFGFLLLLKSMHEAWVDQALGKNVNEKKEGEYLIRITDGKDLWILLQGCLSFSYNYDKLEPKDVEETVAIFLESTSDYLDLWDELPIGEKMRIEIQYSSWISRLEQNGYWVFAGVDPEPTDEPGHKLENWKSVVIFIRKDSSPEIIKVKL